MVFITLVPRTSLVLLSNYKQQIMSKKLELCFIDSLWQKRLRCQIKIAGFIFLIKIKIEITVQHILKLALIDKHQSMCSTDS
jgi:hypothetical protein